MKSRGLARQVLVLEGLENEVEAGGGVAAEIEAEDAALALNECQDVAEGLRAKQGGKGVVGLGDGHGVGGFVHKLEE